MRETLAILASEHLDDLMQGNIPPQVCSISYQNLSQLRPRYAGSSWRVTLSKMSHRGWVVKSYRNGLTTFQLTKRGWQEWKALNPVFLTQQNKQWSLVVFTPSGTTKPVAGQARRLLSSEGYVLINSSTAIRPSSGYSEYLYQQMQRLGYTCLFVPVSPDQAHPIPFSEFLTTSDRSLSLARQCEKISRQVSDLLTKLPGEKKLKNQTKERIGSTYISGINFISRLNWYDLGWGDRGLPIVRLTSDLDRMMREYLTKDQVSQ